MKRIADYTGWLCRQRSLSSRELARRGGLSIVTALQLRDGVGFGQRISMYALAGACMALDARPDELLVIVDVEDAGDGALVVRSVEPWQQGKGVRDGSKRRRGSLPRGGVLRRGHG